MLRLISGATLAALLALTPAWAGGTSQQESNSPSAENPALSESGREDGKPRGTAQQETPTPKSEAPKASSGKTSSSDPSPNH